MLTKESVHPLYMHSSRFNPFLLGCQIWVKYSTDDLRPPIQACRSAGSSWQPLLVLRT